MPCYEIPYIYIYIIILILIYDINMYANLFVSSTTCIFTFSMLNGAVIKFNS